MVKVRKTKSVDEVAMPVEENLTDQLVGLAQGFIDEITTPEKVLDEPSGSKAGSQECRCPRCRSTNAVVETSRPWDDGMKVRYMRCRACRMSFKSILASNGSE